MPKVLCTLPNASTKINGVNFVTHRDGMISEEIDDKTAEAFAAIPGYEIHNPKAAVDPNVKVETDPNAGKQSEQKPPAPPAPQASSAGGKKPPAAPPAPDAPKAPAAAPPPAAAPGKPAVSPEPQF
jgi:2-oxoglutarate dehydrogenase E2 component (dihydrolipoamide succinyltransferase)